MESDFIETRCARLKKNAHDNFVSVEYRAHKKKVPSVIKDVEIDNKEDRSGNEKIQDRNVDPRKQQELAMKRARYEVIKFGMSGLGSTEAQKAKIQSAIALGARPPKNQQINYKKLKEERLRSKLAAKKERISGADSSLAKRKTRRKPRQKDDGILGTYGKVKRGPIGK